MVPVDPAMRGRWRTGEPRCLCVWLRAAAGRRARVEKPGWAVGGHPRRMTRSSGDIFGAGLDRRPVPAGWSLATDVKRLSTLLDRADVACGAGWAASTVLQAASVRRPFAVMLFKPPLGLHDRGNSLSTRIGWCRPRGHERVRRQPGVLGRSDPPQTQRRQRRPRGGTRAQA
jgi:hypothetical protein